MDLVLPWGLSGQPDGGGGHKAWEKGCHVFGLPDTGFWDGQGTVPCPLTSLLPHSLHTP